MSPKEIVFRKKYLSLLSLMGACVLTGGHVLLAVGGEPQDRFSFFPVVSIAVYCLWLLGWRSGVRVRPGELIVDNLAIRHHIPSELIARLVVDGGLEVRLINHKVIGSITFGGSVIGSLLGYKYTSRVRDKIASTLQDSTKSISENGGAIEGRYHSQVCLPLRPMIAVIAFFGISTIASLFF